MKKTLNLILLFLILACSSSVTRNDAIIVFKEQEYDFETIPIKEEAECSFNFSNYGKTPLTINNVKTSCGCIIPEWPRKPVKPGATGEIKVKYDTSFPGFFHKTITVYFNGKDSPSRLTIKGQVEYLDK